MRFEASRAVFWSLSCYKELNLPQSRLQVEHFAAFWSWCKIFACEVQACAESKIKSDTVVLPLTFGFLLLPCFFAFLASFFSLSGRLVGFNLVGKGFRKAFRILGLNEKNGRLVVKQDFQGNFQVKFTWFFSRFSLVSLTGLCSFWYGLKDLFTLHKSADKVILDNQNWWRHKR